MRKKLYEVEITGTKFYTAARSEKSAVKNYYKSELPDTIVMVKKSK